KTTGIPDKGPLPEQFQFVVLIHVGAGMFTEEDLLLLAARLFEAHGEHLGFSAPVAVAHPELPFTRFRNLQVDRGARPIVVRRAGDAEPTTLTALGPGGRDARTGDGPVAVG